MTYFDGTGPCGCGPFTGRGMGNCGFGFRRRRFSIKEIAEMLDEEEKALKSELEAIKEERKNLEA